MEDNKYTLFIRKYRDEYSKNVAMSDDDMANATGGVGGANEATCPECGKPMKKKDNPYGDSLWECPSCHVNQLLSDAEYIEMVRAMEAAGMANQIVYPVWWKQINH